MCKSAEWLPLLDWRSSDLFSNQFEEDQDLLATIPWCGIRISRSEISVPHWLLPICLSLRSVTFATFNSTRGPSTFVSVLPICGIQIPPTSMRNQIDPSVRTPSLSICGIHAPPTSMCSQIGLLLILTFHQTAVYRLLLTSVCKHINRQTNLGFSQRAPSLQHPSSHFLGTTLCVVELLRRASVTLPHPRLLLRFRASPSLQSPEPQGATIGSSHSTFT